jgi:hypothetical protein
MPKGELEFDRGLRKWVAPDQLPHRSERLDEVARRKAGDAMTYGFILGLGVGGFLGVLIYNVGFLIAGS